MKFFQNIKLKKRILLVVIPLVTVMFGASALATFSLTSSRVANDAAVKTETYIQKLADIISEVNKRTGNSYTQQDYTYLKPYFNQPAFYTTDYPYLVDISGNYLIHIYREGQRFPREHLNAIYSSKNSFGSIDFRQVINNKEHRITLYYKKIDSYNAFIGIPINHTEITEDIVKNRNFLLAMVFLAVILFTVTINLTLGTTIKTINRINNEISRLSLGEITKPIELKSDDELGQIVKSLNKLIRGLSQKASFASEIGNNNLQSNYEPLGPNDELGNLLINMRESLRKAQAEEAKRKKEDEQRNWVNSGLAKFGDILRQNNDDLQILADNITQSIVNYLNANQGGLFILNDEQDEEIQLQLLSAFAYSRKKFKKQTILPGEGLVGNCFVEKHTIHLREIPDDYIEITSGLGEATPKSLLIAPLKMEEKVFGVIEIASFNEFNEFEVDFVEKIGENIAATLSAVKNSIRTAQLLEQSQQQREEMAAQEEEMRQNMEEMQATQEEMARKTIEMESMTSAVNEAMIFCELSQDGNFQYANLNFLDKAGYAKTDLDDLNIQGQIHPNDQSAFKEAWSNVLQGHTYKGVLKWQNRSNEELYILSSISPAFDQNNELYKIFFLGQDITDTKKIEMKAQQQAEEIEKNLIELQAEQEIAQENQEKINALLQALDTTCLVAEITSKGVITFINNKNVETLGDSKERIEGRLHSELDYEARTNPDSYKQFWNSILEGNKVQREFSLNVKGQTVWISEHYTPIRNIEGEVVKIINIGINISEYKEVETHMQKQIDELMQQLRKN